MSRKRVLQRIINNPVLDLLRALYDHGYEANWHVKNGVIVFENEPEVELLAQMLEANVEPNWHIVDGKIVIDSESEQPER